MTDAIVLTARPGGALTTPGHDHDRASLRAAALDSLLALGMDRFDAEARVERATLDRGWFSDAYNGFTHDCAAHASLSIVDPGGVVTYPGPWCADSYAVTVVANLGVESWD
jgi:hypothetical protein